MYKSVKIVAGKGGWGGPLILVPTETRYKVVSVTGGGIHPLAAKIAEVTGCTAVDGFTTGVPDEEILLAVVDCGGTARCGVYPKKRILTANVLPVGKTGPLAQFITKELYVSAVDLSCILDVDDAEIEAQETAAEHAPKTKAQAKAEIAAMQTEREKNFVTRLGIAIGGIVNKFYAAGRETIDITIKSILPFMAFVSMILGIISVSGLGNFIANNISPLASSLPGMLIISLICAIPFISPVLGPGAVIAQVVGTLLDGQHSSAVCSACSLCDQCTGWCGLCSCRTQPRGGGSGDHRAWCACRPLLARYYRAARRADRLCGEHWSLLIGRDIVLWN